jgi:hypothetical protein
MGTTCIHPNQKREIGITKAAASVEKNFTNGHSTAPRLLCGVWGSYFFEEDDVTLERTFSGLNWMIFSMNIEQKIYGFNKMVQQLTYLVVRSEF